MRLFDLLLISAVLIFNIITWNLVEALYSGYLGKQKPRFSQQQEKLFFSKKYKYIGWCANTPIYSFFVEFSDLYLVTATGKHICFSHLFDIQKKSAYSVEEAEKICHRFTAGHLFSISDADDLQLFNLIENSTGSYMLGYDGKGSVFFDNSSLTYVQESAIINPSRLSSNYTVDDLKCFAVFKQSRDELFKVERIPCTMKFTHLICKSDADFSEGFSSRYEVHEGCPSNVSSKAKKHWRVIDYSKDEEYCLFYEEKKLGDKSYLQIKGNESEIDVLHNYCKSAFNSSLLDIDSAEEFSLISNLIFQPRFSLMAENVLILIGHNENESSYECLDGNCSFVMKRSETVCQQKNNKCCYFLLGGFDRYSIVNTICFFPNRIVCKSERRSIKNNETSIEIKRDGKLCEKVSNVTYNRRPIMIRTKKDGETYCLYDIRITSYPEVKTYYGIRQICRDRLHGADLVSDKILNQSYGQLFTYFLPSFGKSAERFKNRLLMSSERYMNPNDYCKIVERDYVSELDFVRMVECSESFIRNLESITCAKKFKKTPIVRIVLKPNTGKIVERDLLLAIITIVIICIGVGAIWYKKRWRG